MSNEASRNQRSPQYQGELPDVIPDGKVVWIVKPSLSFLEQVKGIREAGVEGPLRCEEKDQDAVLVALAMWVVPLRTTQNYPVSNLEMAELGRMPLLEFKARHRDNFIRSGMTAAASTIHTEEVKKIEG